MNIPDLLILDCAFTPQVIFGWSDQILEQILTTERVKGHVTACSWKILPQLTGVFMTEVALKMIDEIGLRSREQEMLTRYMKIKTYSADITVGEAPCLSESLSLL